MNSSDQINRLSDVDDITEFLKVLNPHTIICKVQYPERKVHIPRLELRLRGDRAIPGGWTARVAMVQGIDRRYTLKDGIIIPGIKPGSICPLQGAEADIPADIMESTDEWSFEWYIVDPEQKSALLYRSPPISLIPSELTERYNAAVELYSDGKLQEAVEILKRIEANIEKYFFRKAQEKLEDWQRDLTKVNSEILPAARKALESEDFEGAMKFVEEAYTLYPQCPAAEQLRQEIEKHKEIYQHLSNAESLYADGELDKALEEVKAFLNSNPGHSRAQNIQARINRELDQIESKLERHHNQALSLYSSGHLPEAIIEMRKIEDSGYEYMDSSQKLEKWHSDLEKVNRELLPDVEKAIDEQDFDKAKEVLDSVYSLYPQCRDAGQLREKLEQEKKIHEHISRAEKYQAAGEILQALNAVEVILADFPDHVQSLSIRKSLRQTLGQRYFQAAKDHASRNEINSAIEIMEKAIDFLENSSAAELLLKEWKEQAQQAMQCYQDAELLDKEHKYSEAEAKLNEAISLNSQFTEARRFLENVRAHRKEWEASQEEVIPPARSYRKWIAIIALVVVCIAIAATVYILRDQLEPPSLEQSLNNDTGDQVINKAYVAAASAKIQEEPEESESIEELRNESKAVAGPPDRKPQTQNELAVFLELNGDGVDQGRILQFKGDLAEKLRQKRYNIADESGPNAVDIKANLRITSAKRGSLVTLNLAIELSFWHNNQRLSEDVQLGSGLQMGMSKDEAFAAARREVIQKCVAEIENQVKPLLRE